MSDSTFKSGAGGAVRAPKLRYQNRPEVKEIFTDSIRSCVFDGQALRVEFTIARFDDAGALGILEGQQVTAARLVLNRTALLDLFSRLGQLSDVFKREGLVPETSQPNR